MLFIYIFCTFFKHIFYPQKTSRVKHTARQKYGLLKPREGTHVAGRLNTLVGRSTQPQVGNHESSQKEIEDNITDAVRLPEAAQELSKDNERNVEANEARDPQGDGRKR